LFGKQKVASVLVVGEGQVYIQDIMDGQVKKIDLRQISMETGQQEHAGNSRRT